MADDRTGIKYIGNDKTWKDRMFGTGLVWQKGETLPISIDLAKDFLKHTTLFQEVPGFSYVTSTTSLSGVVDILDPRDGTPLVPSDLGWSIGGGDPTAIPRISALESMTAAALATQTVVSYSSLTVGLDATSPSVQARDLVFTGWGERYAPAGVAFNAIRIRQIARTAALATSRWSTLNVMVRTGVNSFNAGASVVAVGSVAVNEASDTLNDVVVALKDPTTGAFKTLTDADFSGGEYMICVYALNSSGAAAACGEPRATQANSLGQSYYFATFNGNPVTGLWTATAAGSNIRIGFQHLLAVNPVETRTYSGPGLAFAEALAAMAVPAPEMVMPPTIYAVQGRECNVYLDNLHVGASRHWEHDITTTGSVGTQQNERWTWTPTAAVTTGTITVDAYNPRNGVKMASKTANIRAAASTAQSGTTKKVMVIGDSLVNAGVITQTLLDIAAGGDVMGVTLLGTQGTAPNKHEGRGGWTVDNYTTAGPTYYDFTVSGITTPPAINAAEYTHNGSTYRVQSVSLSGGVGTIRCRVVSGGAPLASGTLTKSNGSAGDATITFSASATAPGNPFWIGGAVNFAQYLTNNSLAAPDWVFIALGINDVFSYIDDAACSAFADAAFVKLDTLIASIKAAGAGVKVGLMVPSPPSSDQDAFGANYGVGQTRWRDKRNILIWARQMIVKYSGQEANRIYIVPTNTALDTVNNMNLAASAPVNSRSAVSSTRQNNGVHPASAGYQQIGDALWAFMKYLG